MSALSGIYGRVARLRRAWYRPHRQRRLGRPVVSVGNLSVGGSGKTPVVAAVVRALQRDGERPAVLSRGYGRHSRESIVVVSEGTGPLVGVEQSGDEPQMLARMLTNTPVVVSADRHAAGCLAERDLGATVHVLDDGFQHLRLARDVDLLLVSSADLEDRVLPSGRLREPLSTAACADAVLVVGDADAASRVGALTGVSRVFHVRALPRRLQAVCPYGEAVPVEPRTVLAVSGIARPERFHASLAADGLQVAGSLSFGDHHWYTAADLTRVEDAARRAGVSRIVTTAKDAVRLEPLLRVRRPEEVGAWVYLSYEVEVEPADVFRAWLQERVAAARASVPAGA